jgi:hypothetical protein
MIVKVVEHLYKEDLKDYSPEYKVICQRRDALRGPDTGKGKRKTISSLMVSKGKKGDAEYGAGQLEKDEAQVAEIVQRFLSSAKARPRRITSIRFEKLSEGELTYATESVVNGDLPPPRIPPM